jgi:hypothetical protein
MKVYPANAFAALLTFGALRVAALLFAALLFAAAECWAAPPETFQFAVEWRLIAAGVAKLTWVPVVRPKSPTWPASAIASPASEVRLHLESTGLVSRLFRVEDDYSAVLGPNLCAETSTMLAKEGSRSKETRVTYDGRAGKAYWVEKDLVNRATANREVDIPSCVHDVMGGLMALRGLRLEPGKTVRLPLSDGKKTVQARVDAQERQEIRTPLGNFRTIKYEVFLFNDVLFKRPGHLHVWLTDDERRLPVQLQVRLAFTIGTITFRLVDDKPPVEKPQDNIR